MAMRYLSLAAAGAALALLGACSTMDEGAPSAISSRTAASETSPGTGSVAPSVTGRNSSTVTPQSPAERPAPQDTPH
jgi:hypothetical protein